MNSVITNENVQVVDGSLWAYQAVFIPGRVKSIFVFHQNCFYLSEGRKYDLRELSELNSLSFDSILSSVISY